MKHKLLKIGALLFLSFAIASLNAQETVLTSGSDAYGGNGSTSYSIGQVVYYIHVGSPGSLAEGVQQPYEISDRRVGIHDAKDISLAVSAYPNPATDHLILKADNIDLSGLTYELIDLNGRILKNGRITSNETIIDMNDLAPSGYFLHVKQREAAVKVFSIIKN